MVAWLASTLAQAGCAWLGMPVVCGCLSAGDAPAPHLPSVPLGRLVVLGDFGADFQGRNRNVAEAVRDFLDSSTNSNPPALVLLLGDNFYPRGLVGVEGHCNAATTHPEALRQQIEAVLGPYAFFRERGIPVVAVAGNHDHGCGPVALANQAQLDQFLPTEQRWGPLWRFHHGAPQALELEAARVQILLLDSEPMLQDRLALAASIRELATIVQRDHAQYAWRIVAAHHPLRTFGTHDGTFPEGLRKPFSFTLFPVHFLAAAGLPPFSGLSQDAYSFRYQRYRRALEQAFREHPGAVDLFLAGHDHSLQFLPPSERGLPFELIVGSGAYCSPVRKNPKAVFAAAKHGFAVLDFGPEHLLVRIYGTTPCAHKEICPAGSGKAYLLYETVLHRNGATGSTE
ncbi:MAG: metallophosphoesterase [Candidatus Binatia bacterium]|nr:metallophosphoesterase [Candidatus Binatia bacterium]